MHPRSALVVVGVLAASISGVIWAAGATSDSGPQPQAEPAKQLSGAPPLAVGALTRLSVTQNVVVDLSSGRVVPDPEDRTRSWVVAPTADGGVCASSGERTFCGVDDADVQAGRAASTSFPPDQILGQAENGKVRIKPSGGKGVRRGIAPDETAIVAVRDRDGAFVTKTSPGEEGEYVVEVPAQGSGATVEFHDARGSVIAKTDA